MQSIIKYYTDLIVHDKKSVKLCLPNLTIRNHQIIVFDEDTCTKLYKSIQNQLKINHKILMTLDEIQNLLKKCDENAFDIYKGKSAYDPFTALIRHFHLDVKEQIFYKYCKNAEYLLDVGSGKLTDAQFWSRLGVKHVVGIEPSQESIRMGKERLKKFGIKTDINIIQGVGDVDWPLEDKYKPALEHKYDVITFQFTLHYMMYNIETTMKNILRVSKPNTKVIITCMDGQLIHEELYKNNKIEVRNRQEPFFAIFPQYDYKQKEIPKKSDILLYFKGTYGVVNGSVEPLVDINRLINFFENNGFRLLEKKRFLDYNSKNKNKMSESQRKVSHYYTSLIFIKN